MVTSKFHVKGRKGKAGRAVKRAGVLPRHGPYATAVFEAGQWRVKLNRAGQALVETTLAKYPRAINILVRCAPGVIRAVVLARNRDEEFGDEAESAAIAGVCQAATYYDPAATTEFRASGSFESFAAFHVRAEVGRALERFNAWADRAVPLPTSSTGLRLDPEQ